MPKKAIEYIEEELKLKKNDFIHIIQTSTGQNIPEEGTEEEKLNKEQENQNKVYRILELVDRQIRSVSLPSPGIEKLSEVYATSDAKAFAFSQYGEEEESKRFKTFGNRLQAISDHLLRPGEIGFAVSSPTLLLKEGRRKIEVLLDVGLKNSDVNVFQSIFDKNDPFQVCLTSQKQWFTPDQVSFTLGNYVGVASEDISSVEVTDQTITFKDKDSFGITDIGKYIVNDTHKIYEIVEIISSQTARVREVGSVEGNLTKPKKYAANQVYLNALKIEIDLFEDDLPVVPFGSEAASPFVRSDYPSLVCTLNHFLKDIAGQERYKSEYQNLIDLALYKAHLRVEVQDMKNITLQNDRNIIDAKKTIRTLRV